MPTNIELEKKIVELEKKLDKKVKEFEMIMSYPLDVGIKKTIEQTFFNNLKVLTLKGGLPVFTTARDDIPKQGEIYITDISGTRKLNAFISGVNYSVTIT